MNIEAKPYLQDLFDHMRNEHGLILLQYEMQEIVSICNTDLNAENEKPREVLRAIVNGFNSNFSGLNPRQWEDLMDHREDILAKAKQLITEP